MAKNPPVAVVACLECGGDAILRRSSSGRFYTYCPSGHEHRYSSAVLVANRVKGFRHMADQEPLENQPEKEEIPVVVQEAKPKGNKYLFKL